MAVVKSPNDPRDYRVIHLDNDLTALLISDTNTVTSQQRHESSVSETDDDESEGEEGRRSGESSDDDNEEELMDTNKDDDNDRYEKKHKDAKLAAAALCIGTGSFSDPDEIPGLAHFLEHMVFMGSEKYPDENSFDAFLKKHGGSSNACTDCEMTVFVFDIRRKYFREAVDRFAQFFISPLLKEGSVEREIQAVESEYRMSYQSDMVKKMQVMQSMARDGHPYRKFLWGSEATLQTVPREKDIDIQGHLQEFQKKMYSSHYMTLAVCSKDMAAPFAELLQALISSFETQESLDTLEQWVKESYSNIPKNSIPKPSFGDFPLPFEDKHFHKLYKVVPVRDVHQLEITWVLPCQQQHYRIKPLHYISWLLGHEGPGSVLSLLIKRSWAVSLMCGNGETGQEHNSNMALFPCLVNLSDEGVDHIFEIATIIFQYLEMLRHLGPQKRIYEELLTIEYNEFRFQEQCEPYEFVENVVESMQHFPVQDYLTGDQLMWEFNEEVISSAQDLLTPDRANIMLSSHKYKDECTQTEAWFQTPYSCSEINPEWLRAWEDLELNPELDVPTKNEFIATEFDIKEPDCPVSEFPCIVHDTSRGKVWHRKDNKFKTPRARFYFHFISPVVNISPESMVLTDIFLKVLEYNLKEIAYAADVAQLSYSMNVHETGVVLKLDGFSHKLALLFEAIVDHFANFVVTPQIFDMVKCQLMRSYRNTVIKPHKLVRSVRLAILQHVKWTTVDKRSVIPHITIEHLNSFVSSFKSKLYIESLIQGNVTSQEAVVLQQLLYSKLQVTPLLNCFHPEIRVIELPRTECICRIAAFNKEDSNSVVTNYYQCGPASVEEFAKMELLVVKMEEPCFDILRTREQLGYSVFCTCRNTFGVLGFSVTVQTQAEKFSVEHVASRIEAFLDEFKGILKTTRDDDFKSQVDSLIEMKEHQDLSLAEEADRNWYEVLDETYLYGRRKREVEALRQLTKDELIACFESHMRGGDKHSKLSVQIAGFGECETQADSSMDVDNGLGSEVEWVLKPMMLNTQDATCITDIAEFKRTRPTYPVLKII